MTEFDTALYNVMNNDIMNNPMILIHTTLDSGNHFIVLNPTNMKEIFGNDFLLL